MQMTLGATATMLNQLFRGEISAVEAYAQAIETVKTPNIVAILQETHNCHAMRANVLSKTMRELGCEPMEAYGAFAAFSQFVATDVAVLRDKDAIAILEEGEDQSLEKYRQLLTESDPLVRKVARDLLPRQEGTHNIMRDLKLSKV